MRGLTSGFLTTLSFLYACAGSDPVKQVGAGGSGNASGSSAAAGASVTASGGATAGGATAGGATAGGASSVGSAGTLSGSGSVGGGDSGNLFDPHDSVPYDPNAGGAATAGNGGSGGGNSIPGDGNSVISTIKGVDGGDIHATAEFTQKGTDVTVVVKMTKCPDGKLGIFITDGLSCDNDSTEGKLWDGKRGTIGNDGTISCSKNSASLTYTRAGSDTANNWTVGDHAKTDVTQYVVLVTSSASPTSSHIGCGNFFL